MLFKLQSLYRKNFTKRSVQNSYNICLVLEYNGSGFHGWQIQPDQRTIQEELHKTLETITGEKIKSLIASGRTDAGVHARRQVVNFRTKKEYDLSKLIFGVSGLLRSEVSVVHAFYAAPDFHSQRTAIRKRYVYYIERRKSNPVLYAGKSWHVYGDLDMDLIFQEATHLIGKYDFTSFRAANCGSVSPIKEVYKSSFSLDKSVLKYTIEGSGFLKQMVRIIVGTLIERGRGKLDLSVREILNLKDRNAAGITAPSHGLFLDNVEYPEFSIEKLLA